MSYLSTTDFMALLRRTQDGAEIASMPGLDYVIAALSRASMFRLWIGQAPPTANQTMTVWLRPAPALMQSYVFQSVVLASDVVRPTTTLLAIQRNAPTATALVLPALVNR